MDQFTTAAPADGAQPHPIVTLRDHLTEAMAGAAQLRAILATVEGLGRSGIGEHR